MGDITISRKELHRLSLMKEIELGVLTQVKAAEELNITDRQLRRVWKRYLEFGADGLISKRRGRGSNNRLDESIYQEIIRLTKE